MDTIILVIHLLIVIAMVFVIIVQKSGSDGLGGLGGGSSAGGNGLFTVRGQANLLTKMTAFLATGFIVTSLLLAMMASRKSDSVIDKLKSETVQSKPLEAPKSAAGEGKSLMDKATKPSPQVPLAK